MNRYFAVAAIVLILSVLAGGVVFSRLPAQVPVHWDLSGQPNGYAPKFVAVSIMPALMLLTVSMYRLIPWIAPKRYQLDSFRDTYLYIMVALVCIFAYFHGLILASALSVHISMTKAVPAGVSLLLMLMGNVMGKIRHNFIFGVRTPWTLSNPQVWSATHRFAAKIMVAMGLLGMLFALAAAPVWTWVTTVLISVLVPMCYSFLRYKRLEAAGQIS